MSMLSHFQAEFMPSLNYLAQEYGGLMNIPTYEIEPNVIRLISDLGYEHLLDDGLLATMKVILFISLDQNLPMVMKASADIDPQFWVIM